MELFLIEHHSLIACGHTDKLLRNKITVIVATASLSEGGEDWMRSRSIVTKQTILQKQDNYTTNITTTKQKNIASVNTETKYHHKAQFVAAAGDEKKKRTNAGK